MKATVTGTKQLSAKLKSLSVDMQKNLERALTVGALVIQNRAKANAPVVTGNLRRSIHIGGHEDLAPDYTGTNSGAAAVPSPEVAADSATVYVGTNLEYAAIQEFGGTITPKKAKALVFEVDGEVVSVKSVTIPAQPYMRPAYDEGRSEAMSEVSEALADIIRAAAQ